MSVGLSAHISKREKLLESDSDHVGIFRNRYLVYVRLRGRIDVDGLIAVDHPKYYRYMIRYVTGKIAHGAVQSHDCSIVAGYIASGRRVIAVTVNRGYISGML